MIAPLAGWVDSVGAALHDLRSALGRSRVRRALLRSHPTLRLGLWVEVRSAERLRVGQRVTIDNGVLLHCGGMEWSHGRGEIAIGDDVYVGPKAVLFGAGGIEIGSHVLISPGVVITSHQHSFAPERRIDEQPPSFGRVVIEDDVWIGSHATILPGVRIGSGAVIGAGAVVTRDVAAGTVTLGVPAREARRR